MNDLVRGHIEDFPTDNFEAAMASARRLGLGAVDVREPASQCMEPIFATPRQISSGGHRISAMRQQGLRWGLGMCHVDDIGEGPDASVHPLHAYPPAGRARC